MNYLKQILEFNERMMINTLSNGQVALYHMLMHINNKCAWKEWFTVSLATLEASTGLTKNGVIKARNQLQQEGYITFKSNGNKAASYKINKLYNDTIPSNDDFSGIDSGICSGTNSSTYSGISSGTNSGTNSSTCSRPLNKQNKTKLKENISNSNIYLSNARNNENRKPYGLYKNVLLSDVEFQSLVNEFRDWSERLERLSEYMATSGKTYNNHLATIRSWAKTDKVAQLPKVTLSDTEADLLMIKHTKV